jgi:hypothetical protein
MQDLIAWILVVATLAAAYPWACWLIPRDSRANDSGGLVLLLTLALSTGALSLIMLWEALLGLGLSLAGISLPYFALAVFGFWRWRTSLRWPSLRLPQTWQARVALTLMAIICAGILFNSLYWPFSRDDALAIYHHYAAIMADSGALAPLPGNPTLYEAYPILIPLTYSYTYLAAGWHNEFLARLVPALLSIACLGAIYHLGKAMHNATAGWLAALLLALTPNFVSWSSTGYVDLPMAYFYSLAAYFAWHLRGSQHWRDALLSGLMLGLAAWTKNAALVGLPLLLLWLLWIRLPLRLTALAMTAR